MSEGPNAQRSLKLVLFLALSAGIFTTVLSCRGPGQGVRTTSDPATVPPVVETASAAPTSNDNSIDSAAMVKRSHDYGFTFAPAIQGAAHDSELDSTTCLACHAPDSHTMHGDIAAAIVSCVDCHGGNGMLDLHGRTKLTKSDPSYEDIKSKSHVRPSLHGVWPASGLPVAQGAATLRESPDFIRFINPGDLRAAQAACFSCHSTQVKNVSTSMMAHGAMLWEAALYNNGSINRKNAVYGEAYAAGGIPARIVASSQPSADQMKFNGWLPELWPLPRWEVTQPGNILRVFENGGQIRPVVGVPDPEEDAGKPDVKLSVRGLGTDVRTDPVFIGLQKTRLLDPTLNLFGTNDHPGDYRASGCSACHVVFANDSSPVHSAQWAKFGNRGQRAKTSGGPATFPSGDPAISPDESGHPIEHKFVRNMPTSTCIVCHIHPGTNVLNSYLGFTWWDNETDAQHMFPRNQKNPTSDDEFAVNQHNPEATAVRGLWSDMYPSDASYSGKIAGPNFLANVADRINPLISDTQFADFHGHGWVFRAVFKKDRHGNLLDAQGHIVRSVTPELMADAVAYQSAEGKPSLPQHPVHLKDIHLERGMQCVDCHFQQDAHGDGNLYGETRAAVMVDCIDCHGTIDQPARLLQFFQTSDPAVLDSAFTGKAKSALSQKDMTGLVLEHFGIDKSTGRLIQIASVKETGNDMVKELGKDSSGENKRGWFVTQTSDTLNKDSAWAKQTGAPVDSLDSEFNRARYAHTIRTDNQTWGDIPPPGKAPLAHPNTTVSCYACHTSWNTSCFGCHLPMRANQKKPMLHNEGIDTRNYTSYNYQTIRDDLYMLGKDSTVKGGKFVPVRSACAVLVSSQDANRQWIYSQQQTISAEGFAGTSFSPYFPHTVRATETRQCVDCHVSAAQDNNAIMASLLMQGTHAVNFIGRFAWVGLGKSGLQAVGVTELSEPQAVIGSRLHEIAYPDNYHAHLERGKKLTEQYGHDGDVRDLQLRGEYLYAACGSDGFIAYDVANIENKGFSERIITAPVSPLGQRLYVRSKDATSICSPSTMAIDPTRPHLKVNEENQDPQQIAPAIHPLYAYLYLTDAQEGLIVIGNPKDSPNKAGVATLLDGNPDNNFLERALTFNPKGQLKGARRMTLYGHYAYIVCDAGIAVVDLNDPLNPRCLGLLNPSLLKNPRKIVFQFRYGFVIDDDGLKVVDVTNPRKPVMVRNDGQIAGIAIPDARDIYLCRTYAYIAAGKNGLAYLNLERPTQPATWVMHYYDANGAMNDATAVKVAMTNASIFAYVADGKNGLKVLQLTSTDDAPTPTYLGFSPQPFPRLIAQFKTDGPAIALSDGLDRDRAVDESGNQLAVFGRRGARPFNLEEQQKLFLMDGSDGKKLYTVTNEPPNAGETPIIPQASKPPVQDEQQQP
jgi:hypothetical protein